MKAYDKLDRLPKGQASDRIMQGCLVVEGGGLRGMYVMGVLDCLMMNDINMSCYIGVSSGALNGVNYISGQIGRGAYLTLRNRPDSRFIGLRALIENHGITGFKHMWTEVQKQWPLNKQRYDSQKQRFVCVATNLITGKHEFFEKDKDKNFLFALQAGATVPFVSRPVRLNGTPYLDGGISKHIPIEWALKEKFKKIIVIRTREKEFRSAKEYSDILIKGMYSKRFPRMAEKLRLNAFLYNKNTDKLNTLEKKGRIFMLAPSRKLELTLFCDDLEQLAELYYLGLNDTKKSINEVKKYLEG